ncbi:MAG: THUMP domain-containing protein [Bacteroidales bacterium]|jgi:putative N6-adenine-specific DNA methylase|nr:THUMP domain-containing protein [Bacteroidales bacterium]
MRFIAKTLFGLEKVLTEELLTIGALDVSQANRAVMFSGNKELLYRVNYCSRCALSVLVLVSDFRIKSKDDLYTNARRIDWSAIMDADQTFSVVPVVNSELFGHTGFPGLVVKDAVADYFRKKTGKRPSVSSTDPDVQINLHISHENVTISLDSSVIPLFKRGYRAEQGEAPLNEVLAAGILMISGWDASCSLTDPMCGSGTIPIEAGLIACNVPPGKFRQFFGFSRWKDYDDELFSRVKKECETQIRKSGVRISGSDISGEAVKQARANIEKTGLSEQILVDIADFKDIKPFDKNGFVILNPPYGQRLKPDDIDLLYGMIGTTLKHNFAGSKAWIITSGKEYLKNIGLKPKSKHTLFNGALECILVGYELYEGTRKIHKESTS